MVSRTLSGALALKGDWLLGENNWKDEHDLNLVKLSVLVQGKVLDRLSATPGAPVEGDVYIFKADHPTNANAIAAYDEGAWKYIVPWAGVRLYSVADLRFYEFNNGAWIASGSTDYKFGWFFTQAPSTLEVIAIHTFVEAVIFPANFVGSFGAVDGTNAGAAFVIEVAKRSAGVTTVVGTISISTLGVFTFASTGGLPISFAKGERMRLTAPAATDILTNVSGTFLSQ